MVLVEHVTAYTVALQTVNNLTVDGIHTYFVVAGQDARAERGTVSLIDRRWRFG